MTRQPDLMIQPCTARRSLLFAGVMALLYPLVRFLGYDFPRQPKRIEISSPVPASGVLVTGDFILFDRDNSTWAVSRKCTHLGCKLSFHEIGNFLECPCHQSRFTAAGEVLHGPAKEHLAVFPVEKRDTAPFYIIIS